MSEMDKKIPPQNIDAEQSVLGAILIDADAIQRILELVKPDYFYKETHKTIFLVMLELVNKSEPIDLVTLTERLRNQDKLESIGGASYLAELANTVSTSANIEHYARIVDEKAMLRNLISTGSSIVESAFSQNVDTTEILDQAEQRIFEIANKRIKKGFVHIKDIVQEVSDQIENMGNNEEQILGLSSGYVDLDRLTQGFQKQDLIILAARPSVGKTAFCLNIAANIALKSKKNVGIFSLEMSKESLVQRILSSDAAIEATKIRTGKLSDQEWKKLMNSFGRLHEANIFIDDSAGLNALELRAKARRIQAEKGLDIIIIDYLQLMHGTKIRNENRTQEISEIARLLKAVAKELNVPVIALSQLSRAVEQRNDKTPKLSDLRESGEIEQTADLVMFLHREDYYEEVTTPTSVTDVIIAKHRNGPIGRARLVFKKDITKFVSKEHNVDA
ncbi:MAG: replicative DNA helicase [Candidatus Margulisbacteria bacterium GWF2_35_9]|nr:MAG: replicative DNA helicase [Candidatus Margulisbacteria bacterium GWF2_35_9]